MDKLSGLFSSAMRLLCLEDNPLDQKLLLRQLEHRELLGDINVEILFATRLDDALQLLQNTEIDVCIVDLVVPDSSGIATVHAIRNVAPHVALIVVTSDQELLTVRQAVYANVHGYLVKGEYSGAALMRTIIAAWERVQLERKLAETSQQLRQWQSYYRALLEYLPSAVIMTGADERIRYLNAAAQELLGRSSGDLLGEEFITSVTEENSDVAIPQLDGSLRYATVRVQSAIIEGEPVMLYFLHDVTERRRVEQQMLRQQRTDLVGTLAGGIAHDLNNLLSPIMLGVQALMRTTDDERTKKVLTMIEQSARRGADLVRQVLNYTSRQRSQRDAVSPKRLITEVLAHFMPTLPAKITLDTHGVSTQVPSFYANETQIRQLLLNLLTNAREAIGDGEGIIRLSCYQTSSDDARLAGKGVSGACFIAFEVTDTGCGIPEDIRLRVFEPFFTTKSGEEGRGLGLYVVLNIVKQHRGTIHIDSSVGVGTTVSVFFPCDEGRLHQMNAGILIVSSSATVQQLLSVTLAQAGFEPVQVSTLPEALNYFARMHASIDCVIADCEDESRLSIDQLRAIKELKPSVQVVALCNLLMQQALAELEGSVVDRFIPKPYTAETLLTVLGVALGRISATTEDVM